MHERILDGKCALVSGGTRGLGAAISLELLRLGAYVIATYRDNVKAAEQFKLDHSEFVGQLTVRKCDVTCESSYGELSNYVTDVYGKLDILINNAGVNHRQFMNETTPDYWDYIIDTNIKEPFFFTRHFWSLLEKGAPSRIINISSVAGQYFGPKTVHYAVSKTGLNGLTKVLARYGAPDSIYVNALAPGIIMTEQTEKEFQSGDAQRIIQETTLLKRPGTLQDVCSAIKFLTDPQQHYLTGQVINLSGGAILNA